MLFDMMLRASEGAKSKLLLGTTSTSSGFGNPKLFSSIDAGKTWSLVHDDAPFISYGWTDMLYRETDNKLIALIGTSNTIQFIRWSDDAGSTWTDHNVSAFGSASFRSMTQTSNNIYYVRGSGVWRLGADLSADPVSVLLAGPATGTSGLSVIGYNPGRNYLAVAGYNSTLFTSTDGLSWIQRTISGTRLASFASGEGTLHSIMGYVSRESGASYGLLRGIFASNWATLTLPGNRLITAVAWSPVVEKFVAMSTGTTVDIFHSSDVGTNWALATSFTSTSPAGADIFWDDHTERFYAIGGGSNNPIWVRSSPDGISWSLVGQITEAVSGSQIPTASIIRSVSTE